MRRNPRQQTRTLKGVSVVSPARRAWAIYMGRSRHPTRALSASSRLELPIVVTPAHDHDSRVVSLLDLLPMREVEDLLESGHVDGLVAVERLAGAEICRRTLDRPRGAEQDGGRIED